MKNQNRAIFKGRPFFEENRARTPLYISEQNQISTTPSIDHQLPGFPEMDIKLIVKSENEKEKISARNCRIKLESELRVQSYLNTLSIEPFAEDEF